MRNIAGRITGYSILRVLLIEVVVFLVRALPMWLTVASVFLVLIIVWNILKFQFMYLFFSRCRRSHIDDVHRQPAGKVLSG